MKNTIGLILNIDDDNNDLQKLLQNRSLSTLPFGGRYRLIDFTLSNMVNSGINHVGVIGSHKYSSLIDHLGTGKEWSLSRKTQDLSVLAGSSNTRISNILKINLRDLYHNMSFINHDPAENVIIAAPNLITRFDFNQPMKIHKTNNSDLTLIFKKIQPSFTFDSNDVFLEFEKYKITNMHYQSEKTTDYCFADMLIVKKDILIKMVNRGIQSGMWDLMDIIMENTDTLKIFGAPHTGYINRVNNLSKYYEASMDLLDFTTMQELFMGEQTIHTKIKDNHPALYQNGSMVSNSIVGSGSEVSGAVLHSIIFRDSIIEEGSQISNSIIMQKARIGKNVHLDYVISDKDVVIHDNVRLCGRKDKPIVLSKGTVL